MLLGYEHAGANIWYDCIGATIVKGTFTLNDNIHTVALNNINAPVRYNFYTHRGFNTLSAFTYNVYQCVVKSIRLEAFNILKASGISHKEYHRQRISNTQNFTSYNAHSINCPSVLCVYHAPRHQKVISTSIFFRK